MKNSGSYDIVVQELPEEDGGGYIAFVPDLPGCMSDGDTRSQAIDNCEDAIVEWLAEQERRGVDVPLPGHAMTDALQDRQRLLDAIKSLAEYGESKDSEISDLKRKLAELIAVLKDDGGRLPVRFSAIGLDAKSRQKLTH